MKKYIRAYVRTDRLNTALMLCPARSCYAQQTRFKSLKIRITKLRESASPNIALYVHHRDDETSPPSPEHSGSDLQTSCQREKPHGRRLYEPAHRLFTAPTWETPTCKGSL